MFSGCPTKFNIHPAHFLQSFWVGETYFSWTFIVNGGKASNRAQRTHSRMQAFIRSFFNGRYEWTVYFNEAVLERSHIFQCGEGRLDPLKYGTPSNVPINERTYDYSTRSDRGKARSYFNVAWLAAAA